MTRLDVFRDTNHRKRKPPEFEQPRTIITQHASIKTDSPKKFFWRKKHEKIGDAIFREFHLGYKRLCDLLSACQLTTYTTIFVSNMVDSASFYFIFIALTIQLVEKYQSDDIVQVSRMTLVDLLPLHRKVWWGHTQGTS